MATSHRRLDKNSIWNRPGDPPPMVKCRDFYFCPRCSPVEYALYYAKHRGPYRYFSWPERFLRMPWNQTFGRFYANR